MEDGIAKVRAGATLLCDSDPDAEERETRAKAETFINAVIGADDAKKNTQIATTGQGKRVLFVDNRDSFVHTLGDYVRQTGAEGGNGARCEVVRWQQGAGALRNPSARLCRL